jgi:hypothetical protein
LITIIWLKKSNIQANIVKKRLFYKAIKEVIEGLWREIYFKRAFLENLK